MTDSIGFYAALVCSGLILIYLHLVRSRLPALKRSDTFAFFLVKYGHELAAVATISGLTYLLLWGIASLIWEDIPLHTLVQFEETITKTQQFTQVLKPTKYGILIVIVGIIILYFWAREERRQTLYGYIDKFAKWARRAYIFIVVLALFTMLGVFPGEPARNLTVHIAFARQGYANLQETIRNELATQVPPRYLERIFDSLPPNYRTSLDLPDKIAGDAANLRTALQSAQRTYKVEAPSAQAIVAAVGARSAAVAGTEAVTGTETVGGGVFAWRVPVSADKIPPRITPKAVAGAQVELDKARPSKRADGKVIAHVRSMDGRRIALQLPKVITEAVKNRVFAPWISAYPILEPVLDILVSSTNDLIEREVNKRLGPVTERVVANPAEAATIIPKVADEIAKSAQVRVAAEIPSKIVQETQKLQAEVQTIGAENRNLETKVAAARVVEVEKTKKEQAGVEERKKTLEKIEAEQKAREVNQAIGQLGDNDSAVRERARMTLFGARDSLDQRQINKLRDLMVRGGKTWRVQDGRGPHCTWYIETQASYYPASILKVSKSPHIDAKTREAAERHAAGSPRRVRVDDPGWV